MWGHVCGIAGTLDHNSARAASRVAFLNDRQHHRGPDHAVVARAGAFTLGNTRLAIQDPTPAGNQPFTSMDGRYVCVFNGEIYNFPELIDRFGLKMRSHCDGSVIPELWSIMGSECLSQLRGMYAIAVVDLLVQTLFLARDPFGIKPLSLRAFPDRSLVFASEARGIADLAPRAPVTHEAVARYLHLGGLPADESPFAGIASLAPNSIMAISPDGSRTISPILSGEHPLLGISIKDNDPGCLRSVFEETIRMHLRADVPTVLLLSSGVDSSAIASAAASMGRRLHCVTVSGVGLENESMEAAETAQHYGHGHEVVQPNLEPSSLEEFFGAMQRPSIDGLNTFLVCGAVKKAGYRVALTGLGADEALGGYSHYRVLRWMSLLRLVDRIPGLGISLAAGVRASGGGRLDDKRARLLCRGGPRTAWTLDLLQREVLPSDQVVSLTGIYPSALNPDVSESNAFAALVEAEVRNYLQAVLLPDADSFSMCSSVELRVPFVDQAFFATSIAGIAAAKRPGKSTLLRLLEDPFLSNLAKRPKRGFSLPMVNWLSEGVLRPLVDEMAGSNEPVWDFVSRSKAADLPSAREGRWSNQWTLVALNGWLKSLAQYPAYPGDEP